MQDQPNYPIESVDRALSLLALFKVRHAIRLSDAADASGVAKSRRIACWRCSSTMASSNRKDDAAFTALDHVED